MSLTTEDTPASTPSCTPAEAAEHTASIYPSAQIYHLATRYLYTAPSGSNRSCDVVTPRSFLIDTIPFPPQTTYTLIHLIHPAHRIDIDKSVVPIPLPVQRPCRHLRRLDDLEVPDLCPPKPVAGVGAGARYLSPSLAALQETHRLRSPPRSSAYLLVMSVSAHVPCPSRHASSVHS